MSSIVCSEILFCTDRPLNALDAHGNPRCNHSTVAAFRCAFQRPRLQRHGSALKLPSLQSHPSTLRPRASSTTGSTAPANPHLCTPSLVLGSGRVEGGRAVPRGPTPSEGAIPLCDRGWGRTGHPVRGLAVDRIVMECSWSFATSGQTIVPLGVATDLSGARCGSRVFGWTARLGGGDAGEASDWAVWPSGPRWLVLSADVIV